MEDLSTKLHGIIQPIVAAHKVELIELQVKGGGGSRIVKVVVDTEKGIDLDTCTLLSRQIAEAFDGADAIPDRYRLEVSSPGIGRPLHSVRDFARNVNREVEVCFEEAQEEKTVRGKVSEVSEQILQIVSQKTVTTIPVSSIKHGKVCLPW